jgi:hypothetical protein
MDINCTTVLSQQGNYIYKDKDTCKKGIETATVNATIDIEDRPSNKDFVISNQTSSDINTNTSTTDTLEPETKSDIKFVTEPVSETIKVTQIEQP